MNLEIMKDWDTSRKYVYKISTTECNVYAYSLLTSKWNNMIIPMSSPKFLEKMSAYNLGAPFDGLFCDLDEDQRVFIQFGTHKREWLALTSLKK